MPPFREPPTTCFERIANFRDLGGHTTHDGARVASGRLFRSGHLGHASDADVDTLRELGIRRVFDFRTLADLEHDGHDRLPDGAAHLRLPMPDPAHNHDLRSIIQKTPRKQLREVFGDGKAAAMMVEAAELLVRERREPYGLFLTELASAESVPALFHCSAGKDRAGWAGSIVLLALGVDEEQVIEQYLLSNRDLDHIRERVTGPGDDSGWGPLMQPFLEVRLEYIHASFTAVREDWGSFERYLEEGLGITNAQRDTLRDALLE